MMCKMHMFFKLFLSLTYLQIGTMQNFGYSGNIGPEFWSQQYPKCAGKYQSPVNIDTMYAIPLNFYPLQFQNFNVPPDYVNITNNGHTVMIKPASPYLPQISGGPLRDSYELVQMHFHWGTNSSVGSEHQINYESSPMEVHFLFFNLKYGDYNSASNYSDGLCVISVLYQISNKDNEAYNQYFQFINKIHKVNAIIEISYPDSLDSILPRNLNNYFVYKGSLTTPPCSEIVTWIVFTDKIDISEKQLSLLRKVDAIDGTLTHNNRPLQPLNGRYIFASSKNVSPPLF